MSKKFDMTLIEAKKHVAEIVFRAQIPGILGHRLSLFPKGARKSLMRDTESYFGNSQSFRYEQAWAVNGDLRVEWSDAEKTVHGKKMKVAECKCHLSWSSSGHSPASARACIALYSQLTDLAALIECHMDQFLIESSHDAWARTHKEDVAKAKSELSRGDAHDIKWVKTKDAGYYKVDGVMHDLRPKDVNEAKEPVSCRAVNGTGKACTAKAKVIVWDGSEFVLRCGRHSKVV